jgi:tryptophanyl-tRNA synthetase
MTDDADTVAKKIRKATTDPNPLPDSVEGLEGRAEAANLINIFAALSNCSAAEIVQRYAGSQFSQFKQDLAALSVEVLGPIGGEMKRLMADPSYVDGVLRDGSERAGVIAYKHLAEVRDIIGLLKP